LLPLHRSFYDLWPKDAVRNIHLCGDVLRHMPTIVKELNVRSWDTGFPVDHGKARALLGEDVEILGGPEVALLLHGSAQQVYERAKQILQSGVMRGGRFVLREANNLPPCVPEANLSAMYRACLDHGWHKAS
jgi:uroporphyrinogen-III decarboxylase